MRLNVKVKPNSRKDEVIQEADGTIRVRIKAPPVDGKANKHLIAFLAIYFGIPRSAVIMLRGETSQFKTIDIAADESYIRKKLGQI